MSAKGSLSTGVAPLDARIGGFRTGDNVILEVDVGTPPHSFLRAFMRAALERRERVVYVSFDRSPATILDSIADLPEGPFVLIDAFTEGKGRGEGVFRAFYDRKHARGREAVRVEHPHRPMAFHEEFDAATSGGEGSFIVVDSLTGMQELWRSEERVRAFYTHTCPRLFDTRAVAVWVLQQGVHSTQFRSGIGHVAQVVMELAPDGPTLRVKRALGRASAASAPAWRYVDDGATVASADETEAERRRTR